MRRIENAGRWEDLVKTGREDYRFVWHTFDHQICDPTLVVFEMNLMDIQIGCWRKRLLKYRA